MLEFQDKLVVLVEKIVDLGENSAPLLFSLRKNSEYWLEALTVEFSLVV